jgi:uncharacterized protein (DUF433 family)
MGSLRRDDVVQKKSRIVIDPGIMGGKPVIRGTRVPVQVIVGALAGGMTAEKVCKEYRVTPEDVQAALAYAAEALAEETVHALPRR